MGLQRIIGVRKGGKREGHGVMSENDGRRGLTENPYRRFHRS
jgi:hypothetical protein